MSIDPFTHLHSHRISPSNIKYISYGGVLSPINPKEGMPKLNIIYSLDANQAPSSSLLFARHPRCQIKVLHLAY